VRPVLDATAIVALLGGEAGGAEVAAVLRPGAVASAVNLAEARDQLHRKRGTGVDGATATDELVRRGLEVVPCDLRLAVDAAELRAAHYHGKQFPISIADCIGVATARQVGGALVSSDADQCALAVLAGVDVHPIANSFGVRPEV
jgi:PIN domain nuclease of toxin-antitoxin system